MNWNFWKLWELALLKYFTDIYLSWKFALQSTTLLSISVHLKRFQINVVLSQLINLDNIFLDKLPAHPPQNFFYFYGPVNIFQLSLLCYRQLQPFISRNNWHLYKISSSGWSWKYQGNIIAIWWLWSLKVFQLISYLLYDWTTGP